MLMLAGTFGNVCAESPAENEVKVKTSIAKSLRGGGCSDIYGATPRREASNETASNVSTSRVHLVSTTGGESAVFLLDCSARVVVQVATASRLLDITDMVKLELL